VSEQQCAALGAKIAAANNEAPLTEQLVQTHFARTTRRCYVLLTWLSGGSDGIPSSTTRTLYRGESQEVLALARDQGPGNRSGSVFDPSYTPAISNSYDDALAYMDSKMAFD
jgi:hypothetical protein